MFLSFVNNYHIEAVWLQKSWSQNFSNGICFEKCNVFIISFIFVRSQEALYICTVSPMM